MNLPVRSASVLALASIALSASAVDAYNNLGNPVGYSNQSFTYLIGPRITSPADASGFQFASTATGTLSGFQVAVNNGDTIGRIGFSLSLYANSPSDTLGTLLGTYAGTSSGVFGSQTTTALDSVAATGAPVLLASGARYWLVATDTTLNTSLIWNTSNVGTGGPTVRIFPDGTTAYDSTVPAAFSVQVTPVQATPEPSALAALGLGAVALLKRRKRA